ncbi:MAG: 50S ribosomal protein L9 [Gammaproteobacteria bacterium]|nr:50S ribosomal protein L9 [Gammaproteobacteria bacterium]
MEVILLEKVANLGNLGDKVKVKAGYGRNYLIPQKKAASATTENLAKFEARRSELVKAAGDALSLAQLRAEQLLTLASVTIAHNAGEEGKLFGSVANVDIAEALTAKGIEVAKREVLMPQGPFHAIGEYEVTIRLHTDVLQKIKVNVVAA